MNIRFATLILFFAPWIVNAATYEVYPPDEGSCEENDGFEEQADALEPGDVLIVHGGTYCQTGRRDLALNGTSDAPITIRAAEGEKPVLTRPDGEQNNIDIEDSSHLVLKGLVFEGGSIGVRFGSAHHITFTNCEIRYTEYNALTLNSGDTDSFILKYNHIHHTGQVSESEGEGMYIGCNYADCVASNHIIDNNYIHHLHSGTDGGNDGIEVKAGSYGNTIRDNVIHDTTDGTRYPCIFVYGGGSKVNTIERNVLWNCGEAILAISDAVVRNNIVLNSDAGISTYAHEQITTRKNITIVNNTIYGHDICLNVRNATGLKIANNAVYCDGTTAVSTGGSLSGATVSNNIGRGDGISISGFSSGGSVSSTFADADAMDFWPLPDSDLIDAAHESYVPADDFNETDRNSPYDVGAYETEGLSSNPGWAIVSGFKGGKEIQAEDSDSGGGCVASTAALPIMLGLVLYSIWRRRNWSAECCKDGNKPALFS
jgi:hypothetical protein